jgi:hypothetical protein
VFITKTYDSGVGRFIHSLVIKFHLLPREISLIEKQGTYDLSHDFAYPNALAMLLTKQLKEYDQKYNNRLSICSKYIGSFSLKNQLLNTALIRFPLRVTDPQKIRNVFVKQNIFLGKWYDQVIAPMGLDLEKVGYKKGSCVVAEDVSKHIINLPTTCSLKTAMSIVTTLIKLKAV